VRKAPFELAQKLGQLQPLTAVFPQECMGQLASFGPTWHLTRGSPEHAALKAWCQAQNTLGTASFQEVPRGCACDASEVFGTVLTS
jgi:hypothetical protein